MTEENIFSRMDSPLAKDVIGLYKDTLVMIQEASRSFLDGSVPLSTLKTEYGQVYGAGCQKKMAIEMRMMEKRGLIRFVENHYGNDVVSLTSLGASVLGRYLNLQRFRRGGM